MSYVVSDALAVQLHEVIRRVLRQSPGDLGRPIGSQNDAQNIQFLRVTGAAITEGVTDYYPAKLRTFSQSGGWMDAEDGATLWLIHAGDVDLDTTGSGVYGAKQLSHAAEVDGTTRPLFVTADCCEVTAGGGVVTCGENTIPEVLCLNVNVGNGSCLGWTSLGCSEGDIITINLTNIGGSAWWYSDLFECNSITYPDTLYYRIYAQCLTDQVRLWREAFPGQPGGCPGISAGGDDGNDCSLYLWQGLSGNTGPYDETPSSWDPFIWEHVYNCPTGTLNYTLTEGPCA